MADVSCGIDVAIRRKVFARPDGDLTVLRDLRLRVAPGEFVCVLGPSGCGKSSLLNILAGLDVAFDGEIRFDTGSRPRQGVMFQAPRLMPWLSLRANLDLVADPAARRADRPAALLRAMGLDAFANATPGHVSGGMQRRAALARALVNETPLLLLDEPFTSLDAPTAAPLHARLLAETRRTGQTVVCITHDLREALVLADRLVFLSARPANVALDQGVPLARPRDIEGPDVAAYRDALLARTTETICGTASAPARPRAE